MSDADTIRRDAQRIIDQPQMPTGGSENGDEAWYWTHEHLAGFAQETLALLAENERLRIAERAHYRTALENGQKLEAAQRENERLRAERDDARHGRELARLDTERERAENERLREALVALMAALVVDENGDLCSPTERWAPAWAQAQDALAAVPEERG